MLCSHMVAEKCLFWLVNHELVHKNDMKNTSIIYLAYDMPFCQIIQKRIHISYAKVAFNFYMTLQKIIRQPYFLGSSFANALFIIEPISK